MPKKVGEVLGQTGWTGVNMKGEKTMSYRISIIVNADVALSEIFALGRTIEDATMLGWWIPSRGEALPPEKWTMNMIQVALAEPVSAT